MLRHVLDQRSRLEHATFRLGAVTKARATVARRALAQAERALGLQHPRVRITRDRRRLAVAHAKLFASGRTLARDDRARLLEMTERLRSAVADLVPDRRDRLRALTERLLARGHRLAEHPRLRLARAAAALHAMSPLAVLERGYAVVTTGEGRVVTDTREIEDNATIRIRLRRGNLAAVVVAREPDAEDPTAP